MAHHDLKELLRLWEREDITTEQAIGQILLVLWSFNQRLLKLEATRSRSKETPPKRRR